MAKRKNIAKANFDANKLHPESAAVLLVSPPDLQAGETDAALPEVPEAGPGAAEKFSLPAALFDLHPGRSALPTAPALRKQSGRPSREPEAHFPNSLEDNPKGTSAGHPRRTPARA